MTAAQDLFFLAHYAYNTLNPLVDEAKTIEPSVQLGIEEIFGHEKAVHSKVQHVTAYIHWGREGMLAMSSRLHNKTEVDLFAETLRAKIDKLHIQAAVAADQEERRKEVPWQTASLSNR